MCLAYPARHEPGARTFTRSREIHRVAIANLTPLLHEALEAAGLDITEVDYVIPHQTSARAIRKGMAEVEEELGGSPKHPAVVTVDRFGNTASTTHFVALYEYLEIGSSGAVKGSRSSRSFGTQDRSSDLHGRRFGGQVWERQLTPPPL